MIPLWFYRYLTALLAGLLFGMIAARMVMAYG